MAPKKITKKDASSSAGSKKASSSTTAASQGLLSFKATTRGGASSSAKPSKTKRRTVAAAARKKKAEAEDSESDYEDPLLPLTDSDGEEEDEEDDDEVEVIETEWKQGQNLDVNGNEWNAAYKKARKGFRRPIHTEEESKVDHVLRSFDLAAKYGPCTSLTRLQRWERAERLGLNPPPVVRQILLSKQGVAEDRYKENVFLGRI